MSQVDDSVPGRLAPSLDRLTERQLLQSIAEAGREIFGAVATSIFLVSPDTGELIFEAVSGSGEQWLPGQSFPAGTGIAGWVAACGEPTLVENVSNSANFSRGAAESTGYVPSSIMAAPLIRDGECLGVIEVMDKGQQSRGALQDIDLLGLLANQAAIGVELLRQVRGLSGTGQAPSAAAEAGRQALYRIGSRLMTATEPAASLAVGLLKAVDEMLSGGQPEG
jgi:GAF domain-containing protein